MNKKVLWAMAAVLPVVGLIGLLGWALAKTGGQPGGFGGINAVFGEVSVQKAPASNFTLPTLDGGQISLADLKGKVVMLDFWSSWCAPCIAESPALETTYRMYQSQGVVFIGIAIWDQMGAVQNHVTTYGVSYPNGLDVSGKIAVDYGVRGIPEKYFIDKQGNLVKKFIGPASVQDLSGILDGMLAQPG